VCEGPLANSPPVTSPVLSVEGVSKSFGGVAAVRDVSLALHPGEIRGLIGPNGSGKTTLLNLIGGQVAPDRGVVRLGGQPIQGMPAEERAARGVAGTFQLPRVFRSLTVLENVLVPACADHRSVGVRDARRRAAEVLRLVGLDAVAAVEARTLSGGQAMLLQLARCLVQDPLVLVLLDEPFAGVHPAIKEVMVEAVRVLARDRGSAVLVVSHEVATLRRLVHRATVLHNGECIADGGLDEIAADPRVVAAYLGRRDARSAGDG
jgi:branched-chain amino acid transport system ATP-binding protein